MELLHSEITRSRIQAAERLIRPHIRRTPVLEASAADFGLAPAVLIFKLELFQHAGSFKARGAFTNLLSREVPEAGVVAASGGNHGVAVAFAAMRLSFYQCSIGAFSKEFPDAFSLLQSSSGSFDSLSVAPLLRARSG